MNIEEITEEYRLRKDDRGQLFDWMRRAREHFNGDVVIPLPQQDEDEMPAVANLMAQGLDQTGMRVASVLPNLQFPALIPGLDKGTGSQDWAYRRRMAVTGWWQHSELHLKLRRLARWQVGYGTGPLFVRPDFEHGVPRYVLRDPLGAYPDIIDHLDESQPNDIIYAYSKTFGWLESRYPEEAMELRRALDGRVQRASVIDLIEYNGPEDRVLGVIAVRPRSASSLNLVPRPGQEWAHTHAIELTRTSNRTGRCWASQANRITIDRLQGQFDQVFGVYQQQAQLMALETIAVKKAIFPDLALVGTAPGRIPQLVNGTWADGRTGEINVVRDGQVVPIQLNPGFMTQPLIDRHERTVRQSGVPAQFTGESPTNIATGRLGNQILSATVDFPIQEYQESLAATVQHANKAAIAIARAYFGSQKKTFHISFGRTTGMADYIPEKHFETDAHFVRYAQPGADVNSLVIGIGQRVGLRTMSRELATLQDPMIPDPEYQLRKVKSEAVQDALLEYVSTQVVQGALDPLDVILLSEELEAGENLAEAWRKAQAASQKRQAEAQQAAQQAAGQGPVPEAQPGLSPEGAEPPPAVAGPEPSQQNLAAMLQSLRQPRAIMSPMSGSGPATPPSVQVG